MIPNHLRDTALGAHGRLAAATGTALPLRLWDGTEVGPPDPPYRLVIHHPSALRALLLSPSDLRAGEAYVFGDVDVEGDMVALLHDVTALRVHGLPLGLRAGLLADALHLPADPRRRDGRRARLAGRRHSIDRDRAAVRFHYELGNDFFQLFLDRSWSTPASTSPLPTSRSTRPRNASSTLCVASCGWSRGSGCWTWAAVGEGWWLTPPSATE